MIEEMPPVRLDWSWSIYALIDPDQPTIPRYVGKTGFNCHNRLYAHILAAKTIIPGKKNHWIRTLLAEGRAPQLLILERGDGDWRPVERRWIADYRAKRYPLLNIGPGGESCYPVRVRLGDKRRRKATLGFSLDEQECEMLDFLVECSHESKGCILRELIRKEFRSLEGLQSPWRFIA